MSGPSGSVPSGSPPAASGGPPASGRAEAVEGPTGPGPVRMFLRALARRCPWCGAGDLFPRWFGMRERCPGCGLRFERTEGHWLGAVTVNTIATFGFVAVAMAVGLALTWERRAWLAVAGPVMVAAVLFGMVFDPWSRTLWTAFDLWWRPPEPFELLDDAGDPPAAPPEGGG